MRRFVSVLSELPQLSDKLIYEGGLRLVDALERMHAAGRMHCDVKGPNVLLTEKGHWYLGDYGASVKVGEKVWSCTEQFYPGKSIFTPADPKLDWGMLTVLLLVELKKKDWAKHLVTMAPRGAPRVTLDKVQAVCQDVRDSQLRGLLKDVVAKAGWPWMGD
ncbi:g2262 [Coccomyxa elongata]